MSDLLVPISAVASILFVVIATVFVVRADMRRRKKRALRNALRRWTG